MKRPVTFIAQCARRHVAMTLAALSGIVGCLSCPTVMSAQASEEKRMDVGESCCVHQNLCLGTTLSTRNP